MRAILEAQGADVTWDEETQTVYAAVHKAKRGDISITYKIGDKTALVSTNQRDKSVVLAVPGKIQNGTTMLPLRFFSEAMGNNVGWEGKTRSITISTTEKEKFRVTQVFDDNTIGVFWTNKEERIRLIGIEPFSIQTSRDTHLTSSEVMNDWLTGRMVWVEHRNLERDTEGDVLAYVYLEDGTLLNSKLIAEGYAQTSSNVSDSKWASFFTWLQSEAMKNKRGLWKDVTNTQSTH
jgi:endonuclease YncB( thermonuclease family)